MASGQWAGSTRRETLPANWCRTRNHVLKRDGRICKIQGPTCITTANEVDHIGDRRNDDPSNLRAACRPCHAARSAQQGASASAQQRRRMVAAKRRKPERHPGLL